jgi:soluble lytic murein transglycosylase-like protein
MQFHPSLVMKGAVLGSILLSLLGLTVTARIAFSQEEVRLVGKTMKSTPALSEPDQESTPTQSSDGKCQVSDKFPKRILKWCKQITSYASKYDLPPNLVAAIIWQESGGNPSAYSSSGAVGLMQVMASDGLAASFQCANGPCFASRPNTARLKDPEYNIQYGVRLLSNLVKQHGELRLALKAYGPINAGYSYADKVLSIYKHYGK